MWIQVKLPNFPDTPKLASLTLNGPALYVGAMWNTPSLRVFTITETRRHLWTTRDLMHAVLVVRHISHLRLHNIQVGTQTQTPYPSFTLPLLSCVSFVDTDLYSVDYMLTHVGIPNTRILNLNLPLEHDATTSSNTHPNIEEVRLTMDQSETSPINVLSPKDSAVRIATMFPSTRTLRLHADLFCYFEHWQPADDPLCSNLWPVLEVVEVTGTLSSGERLTEGIEGFLAFSGAHRRAHSPIVLNVPGEFLTSFPTGLDDRSIELLDALWGMSSSGGALYA